MQTDSSTVSSI